jgi:hypothetical protein
MSSPSIFNKARLSGSTDGKAIGITATGTPGTTIHTAVSGTTANTWDEIYLWAMNSDTVPRKLTIEFGGTSSPDDLIEVTIPTQGLCLVVPAFVLDNGTVVRAFASVANTLSLAGFVNEVRP